MITISSTSTKLRLLCLVAISSTSLGCNVGIKSFPLGDTGAAPVSDDESETPPSSDDDGSDDNGSDDDESSWGGDDGSGSGDDGSGSGASSTTCTYDEFPALLHQAIQDNGDPERPLFTYQARDAEMAPFDELRIESYQADPYYGPTGPGSYSLAGTNYENCALCVYVIENCSEDYMCDKVYFVDQGTLDISSMSTSGGTFSATLRNALFREVSIDSTTYASTPVPGGQNWCVESLDIELPITMFY
jgi:hypothetical protein